MSKLRLGEYLVAEGVIDSAQLQAALGFQRRWGKKLGECLVQLGTISENKLCQILSKALKIPMIDLGKIDSSRITRDILSYIGLQTARTHRIVPLAIKEVRGKKRLVVSSSDPLNFKLIDELQFKTGFPILMMVSPESDIEWFIRKHYLGEQDALSFNYVSGASPLQPSSPDEKMEIDPVSSIFFDATFTGMTQIGKTNPAISLSRSKKNKS
jgi:hypothetical protein